MSFLTRFWQKLTSPLGADCGCGSCPSDQVTPPSLGLSPADTALLSAVPAGVVIGQIQSIAPHPDPKVTKVQVTQTTVGGEPLTILCGAANIAPGQLVPVATVGTTLGESFTIGERAIRGVTSHGMICAKDELGLPKETDGIWVLPTSLQGKIGTSLRDLA